MKKTVISLLTGLIIASAASGFDGWPQWLGPTRNSISVEKGWVDEWEGKPPLLWKVEGLGAGYAGAVVSDGVVCTMGDRDNLATVIALNAKNGKELWATPIADTAWGPRTGSRSTPTIDGDRVYAVDSGGHLVCLKAATGEVVWDKYYREDFDGRCHGEYSESPLIDGDKLICSPGGPEAGIVALHKKTGKEIWRCAIERDPEEVRETYSHQAGAVNGSPVISQGAGVKQYIQLMAEGLVGVDAETGKQLWISSRCCSYRGICTPIVRGDYVFRAQDAGPKSHRSVLLKLERGAKGSVKAKEVYALDHDEVLLDRGNVVLVGDYLYVSDYRTGSPQCVDFLTGKLMWEKWRGVGKGSAAVIYADGNLYYHYENGVNLLVEATPKRFQVKGKFHVPDQGQIWSYPAMADGRLYVRKNKILWCYNLRK